MSHGQLGQRRQWGEGKRSEQTSGSQWEGRGSIGFWCVFAFIARSTCSLRTLISEESSHLAQTALCSSPLVIFFFRVPFSFEFKSRPPRSVSTLWLGYCSCSCCWCQQEATPRYLAPHWSLSPLCHHKFGLRLEEDDNGRSEQFATVVNKCHRQQTMITEAAAATHTHTHTQLATSKMFTSYNKCVLLRPYLSCFCSTHRKKTKTKNVHANDGDSDVVHTLHSVSGHKEETDRWMYSQVTNTRVC